jgi:catechol 2,3-dioxygenase-like lactoylglutathione lyase family enzyme
MSDSIKLSSVTLECPNAGDLAAFYADITGGKVTFLNDAWATVNGPGGRIEFQTAPGYTPPTWPDPTSSMQIHLDFYVDDLDAAEARVLAAGASKYDFQPNSDHCYVFADPTGHPFCLTTWDDVPS